MLHRSSSHRPFTFLLIALAASGACGRSRSQSAALPIRLVDVFKPEAISGGGAAHGEIPRTEWKFDGSSRDTWDAGPGVTGLTVREGRLTGRTSSTFPMLHVKRSTGLDSQDVVHAIEIRMRVSAVSPGGQLALTTYGTEKVDLAELAKALDGWHQMALASRIKPDAESTKNMTPSQLQKLKSLGYVK